MELWGPFAQVVTLRNLPEEGKIFDTQLEVIPHGGILVDKDHIVDIKPFSQFKEEYRRVPVPYPSIVMPGFVDAHTHLLYAGTRAHEYALKLQGKTYLDIARMGGGILHTVKQTRSSTSLEDQLKKRLKKQALNGTTTIEIKTGYGLSVKDEINQLKILNEIESPIDIVPTCLAAHVLPPEFTSAKEYLGVLVDELLPLIHPYTKRIDIFVDESAFPEKEGFEYLQAAKKMGFSVIVHADQFRKGGAMMAASLSALSADHLETSTEEEIIALKTRKVIPIVLPGASLGLGLPFPKARLMLNRGLPLVIASDTNPGSAPMGDLLTEAAILSAYEKLTNAEVFAAITIRAAKALELNDRGILDKGKKADFIIFPTDDYREILYYQGSLKPIGTVKNGVWLSVAEEIDLARSRGSE